MFEDSKQPWRRLTWSSNARCSPSTFSIISCSKFRVRSIPLYKAVDAASILEICALTETLILDEDGNVVGPRCFVLSTCPQTYYRRTVHFSRSNTPIYRH